MKQQVVCHLARKTPGAIQYKQVDENGEPIRRDRDGQVVGNFYLRKSAVKGRPPEKITLTIEY
jgi:hypothetical protein